ncbi:ArnT family glycosyltransferase [Endothiovibrio diazotrophicus]
MSPLPPRPLSGRLPLAWSLGWLLLLAASLAARSYVPIDETRYVTVAWEMWLRGDFLVPHLNGELYSHKPPLMFWLYDLGWWLFGVNDWWPRLVAPLFGLGSLWLTRNLARRLWPEREALADHAPLIVLGGLFWAFYTTASMFDMLVVFFTLLGFVGTLIAWRGQVLRGFGLLAVAIGLGVLAKGPIILLTTLPPALLAPWWMSEGRPASWHRWYLGILAAVLGGAAIALAWAIPAAIRGGEKYADAIFWGQTANRMVNSFAHRRGVFWYLPLLPLLLFPWFLWPRLWVRLAALRRTPAPEPGVRFCLAAALPLFIALSLISGKQLHYLLPIFPMVSLLAARALDDDQRTLRDLWLPGALAVAAGTLLLTLPWWREATPLPTWGAAIQPLWGLPLVALGLVVAGLRWKQLTPRLLALAATGALAATLFQLALFRAAGDAYDLTRVARYLGTLQTAGANIANVANYHGEYQFLGRLTRPLEEVTPMELTAWAQRHPDGYALIYYKGTWPRALEGALYSQNHRGGGLAVWRSADIVAGRAEQDASGRQLR